MAEGTRYECCKTRFNKHLQGITSQLYTFCTQVEDNASQYSAQASRLCELSQRERLINGENETITALFISASQDVYQLIYHFINNLKKTEREIKNQVEEFKLERHFIIENLSQYENVQRRILSMHSNWSTWCELVLDFTQTHINYLELQTHSLLPMLIKSETVENIKNDMQISTHFRIKYSLAQMAWHQFVSKLNVFYPTIL